jgi:hypothetical protein
MNDKPKQLIDSTEADFSQSMEQIISEQIVSALADMGVDVNILLKDVALFGRELKEKKIRFENLMFPLEPSKSGIYFYKNNVFCKFVFIPRSEGMDITNFFGDHL